MKLNSEKYKQRGEKLKLIRSIREIIDEGQLSLAIRKMKSFMQRYGDDCQIMYLYGKILRKTGEIDEAILILKRLLDYQKGHGYEEYSIAAKKELFKIYFINDRYEEAYEMFEHVRGQFYLDGKIDEVIMEKILKIRLGIYKEETEKEPIIITKLLHYDEDKTYNHIKRHLEGTAFEGRSVFRDVDINDLFERVKKALPTAKKTQRFSMNDIYVFRFSRIGMDGCNLLQVVTNKGTNEIITIYPTEMDYKGYINNNLYEQYLDDREPKTKKLSQIDKFRRRYSLDSNKK